MKFARPLFLFAFIAFLAVAVAAPYAIAVASGSRNIFDDDWTPPKRGETARPAPVTPVTPPAGDPAKVDPPNATPKDPAPAAIVPAARRAVPGKSEQAAVRKVLKEVFAQQLTDRTPAGRRKLTEALLAQAEKSADVPVDQFVLLAAAVDAGGEAASLPLAFQAADRMAAGFEVDALAVKAETTTKLAPKPGATDSVAENVQAGLALADDLVDADDFNAAARVCSALMPVAASNPALRNQVVQRQRELKTAKEASEKVARHVEKLKTTPDDPTANIEVGKYLCFVKGDWKAGLPALARGSDAGLKGLATRELASPDTADAQAALGDAWWDAAASTAGPGKQAIQVHAGVWYEKALPGLKGLGKAKVEQRLESARATAGPGGGTRAVVAAPSKLEPGLMLFEFARISGQADVGGKPVDLSAFGKPLGPPTVAKSLNGLQSSKGNNVVVHGYLSIEQAGKYAFQSVGWGGHYYFVVDDVLLNKFGVDRHTAEIELTKGVHRIMFIRLVVKEEKVLIDWKPPGQEKLVSLPDAVLFHDAANTPPPVLPSPGKR